MEFWDNEAYEENNGAKTESETIEEPKVVELSGSESDEEAPKGK